MERCNKRFPIYQIRRYPMCGREAGQLFVIFEQASTSRRFATSNHVPRIHVLHNLLTTQSLKPTT